MAKSKTIDFQNKLISHESLNAIRDVAGMQDMVGSKVAASLVDNLQNLRYLAEYILYAHEMHSQEDIEKALTILRRVL